MNESKKIFYKNQAETIIKKLEARKMQGFYVDSKEEACAKVLELIGDGCKSVAYGGSVTIDEIGAKAKLAEAGHDLIVRENYKTAEEQKELKARVVNADSFLMSTNAITLDGVLINIDGFGNRVSSLIYGPDQVIIVAGMNKVAATVEEGVGRARNMASAPNCVRLHRETPCSVTGRCGNCLEKSICCEIVITRSSMIKDRIKVILVGEELGY